MLFLVILTRKQQEKKKEMERKLDYLLNSWCDCTWGVVIVLTAHSSPSPFRRSPPAEFFAWLLFKSPEWFDLTRHTQSHVQVIVVLNFLCQMCWFRRSCPWTQKHCFWPRAFAWPSSQHSPTNARHRDGTLWRESRSLKVGRREKQELLGAGLTLMEDYVKTKDRAGIPWVLFLPAKLPSAAAHLSIALPLLPIPILQFTTLSVCWCNFCGCHVWQTMKQTRL